MSEERKPGRYELYNRYLFEGRLEMQTALHIGGGKLTLSYSNSPVVLTPEGYPFVPGSSFKGALRSTVEKLVPGLPGIYSCGLIELSDKDVKEAQENKIYVCPTVRQREIQRQRRNASSLQEQEKIMQDIYDSLCDTCQLFGSPFAAARVNVNDLYLAKDKTLENELEWSGVIQVRDGVAIDRDSESAKSSLKYDFEVVPASTVFALKITLENVTSRDLQLISIGLSDFVQGFGMIGGKRSRGLGACRLVDLKVSAIELSGVSKQERSQRLQDYLLRRQFSEVVSGQNFLEKHISALFSKPQEEQDLC